MGRISRRRLIGLGAAATVTRATGRLPAALASKPGAAVEDRGVDLVLARTPDGEGWLRSEPVSAVGCDLAGFSWADRAPIDAELRVRRDGGWERWTGLSAIDDHLPDGAASPSVTAPIWFGGARKIQFRVSRNPLEPRARLVRSASSPAVAFGRRQIAGAPPFVPREEWTAQRPRVAPVYGRVRLAFVHHTVTANEYLPEDAISLVRSIQDYHRNVLGWNDIGYNALIDAYGQIFEGRAGGLDQPVVGAQAQGFNELSTGVAMLGTHTSTVPTAEALDALATFLAWKLAIHDLNPAGRASVVSAGGETNRFLAGRRVRLPRICGHRKGNFTACPGDALYGELPALRRRVARRIG